MVVSCDIGGLVQPVELRINFNFFTESYNGHLKILPEKPRKQKFAIHWLLPCSIIIPIT